MNLFNLTNVIEKPTRVTEHSSTLLDPIIISDSVHYSFSDVLKVPSDISDHTPLLLWGMSRWKYYTFHQHPESQKVMHSNRRYLVCLQFFHCQFANVIEKPTRVTEHSSTLLDPIIISDSIHYSFSDVLKVPSDIGI
jgi:hypothetical protein